MLKGPLQIGAGSTHVTTTSSAQNTTIPNGVDGAKAAWVYLSSGGNVLVRPIQTGETPANTTCMLLTPEQPLILNVHGFDEIRNFESTSGALLVITPLENQ